MVFRGSLTCIIFKTPLFYIIRLVKRSGSEDYPMGIGDKRGDAHRCMVIVESEDYPMGIGDFQ